jgi:23S rRNA pseudouridine1911/1915/1917 synthase
VSDLKPPVTILYEDNHLLVVNKRVSDIVQGDSSGDASLDVLLKDFIKLRDHKPGAVFLGIPHRLDRPVSGAVVFAKTARP